MSFTRRHDERITIASNGHVWISTSIQQELNGCFMTFTRGCDERTAVTRQRAIYVCAGIEQSIDIGNVAFLCSLQQGAIQWIRFELRVVLIGLLVRCSFVRRMGDRTQWPESDYYEGADEHSSGGPP